MPKKGHRKNSKKMKHQNQENEARSAEKKQLKEMLIERDLFRPGMKIQEMRELCTAIEESMLDHELLQRSNQFNGSFRDEDLNQRILRDFTLLENPASSEKLNFISDPATPPTNASPPKFTGRRPSPNMSEFPPLTSPIAGKAPSGPCSKPSDSDSDGDYYSPEFPGPCCRISHVVQVEVHPEPRAYDCNGDDDKQLRWIASPGIKSSPRLVKPSAKAWDAIDEVP
ncbi:uncharacterized protein LOC5568689 [Aedes aegypti]|uniref:Uncharacterized protein n=1 Tax=Aedes aegypti TaxID=7159 RepID=A0A1S4FFC7_AEDAE|nr:uncharacterized protein LOC5568689 [Aedes aegypti]XP_021708907.1 uncharacterized protein LOC5568689 [Aedes aegypti]